MPKKKLKSVENQTSRIEAFSDGVFAIAVTLLVLDIKVPDSQILVLGGLWKALYLQWPEYLSYAISFLVIGLLWASHHQTFKYISRSDSTLIALNMVYLMCVAFIPFPTEILSEYMRFGIDGRTAAKVYSVTMTVTSILNCVIWAYATHGYRLIDGHVPPSDLKKIQRINMVETGMYAVSFCLAFWDTYLSLAMFIFVTFLRLFPLQGNNGTEKSE